MAKHLPLTIGLSGGKKLIEVYFMRKIILVFLLSLLSGIAVANDDSYKFCSIAGYLYGGKSDFYGSLASSIMLNKYEINDPVCGAVYREAYQAGEYFSRTGKVKDGMMKVMTQSSDFKGRIDSFILKGAGY